MEEKIYFILDSVVSERICFITFLSVMTGHQITEVFPVGAMSGTGKWTPTLAEPPGVAKVLNQCFSDFEISHKIYF